MRRKHTEENIQDDEAIEQPGDEASNGQVVATGEAYETKAAAKKGCESVLRAATGASIEEVES